MSWLDRIVSAVSEIFSEIGGRVEAFSENLNDRATEFLNQESDAPILSADLSGENIRGPFFTQQEAEKYASEIPLPTIVFRIDTTDGEEDDDLDGNEEPQFFVEVDY